MPRLFLALGCPGFRPGPLTRALGARTPSNPHLTLAFLGERDDAAALAEAAAPACRDRLPLTLCYRGVGGFPSERRARVAWVGVAGDGLTALAEALRCAVGGAAGGDERPFIGHLTIARFRRPRSLAPLAQQHHQRDFGSDTVERVTLFASELRPGGAVHTPLAWLTGEGKVEIPK